MRKSHRIEVWVDEGEALELLLADGFHHLRHQRGQHRLFLGELGVEIQGVLFGFLWELFY